MPRDWQEAAAHGLLWRANNPYPHSSPHLGLLFERYPRLSGEQTERLEWLRDFLQFAEGPSPAGRAAPEPTQTWRRRLAEVHERLDALLTGNKGEKRIFATASRLAIGLGNANAIETGFAFDAACGLPVLAGSAVKGLARAGAVLTAVDGDKLRRRLGDGPVGKASGNSGDVIFLDALPAEWPRFDIDIINRHHDAEQLPWQKLPLDADKPNPLHFLVVRPGVGFTFRIMPARGAEPSILGEIWEWLTVALDVLGAGAKTAVGYGQLKEAADKST